MTITINPFFRGRKTRKICRYRQNTNNPNFSINGFIQYGGGAYQLVTSFGYAKWYILGVRVRTGYKSPPTPNGRL